MGPSVFSDCSNASKPGSDMSGPRSRQKTEPSATADGDAAGYGIVRVGVKPDRGDVCDSLD